MRDSPAAIAGIRPNDILIAVDGQQTLDQDPVTIAALLAGAEGSAVTVSWRGRDGRTREAQLVRVMVPPETVFAQRSDDVLVLRISSFSNSTASHMALSVQDALSEPHPVGGIVLDLRDNRGGLLRQAVTAADTFLPAGLVATTVGRDAEFEECLAFRRGRTGRKRADHRPGRWPHRQCGGNPRRRPRRPGTRRRGRQ